MITMEEIQKIKRNYIEPVTEKHADMVTKAEMERFNTSSLLAEKLGEIVDDYFYDYKQTCNGDKPLKYPTLSKMFLLNESTVKAYINGRSVITRETLYKFVVGMHLSLNQANELFSLCGGELRSTNLEDYICIKSLEDKDSIESFVNQINKYSEVVHYK